MSNLELTLEQFLEQKPLETEGDFLEWVDEKTQYKCYAVRNAKFKTWCGYVGVPKEHFLYGLNPATQEFIADVHGGVTYLGFAHCLNILEEKPDFLIGFDCCHASDLQPFGSDAVINITGYATYKTLEFVKKECEKLADELFDCDKREKDLCALYVPR